MWLDVLELLDRQALVSIALTSKTFLRLSTPLLMQELHFELSPTGTLQAPGNVEALLVRSIIVSAQPTNQSTPLCALLAHLPQFVNVQSLTLRGVALDLHHYQLLRQMLAPPLGSLPHLTSLALIHCNCNFLNVDAHPLPLRRIYVDDKYLFDQRWDQLASPAHLTHLTLSFASAQGFQNLPCLPGLRFLHIPRHDEFDQHYARFMAAGKCPNLETFELEPSIYFDTHITVIPGITFHLPKLRSYLGPAAYIPLFAQSTSLAHASLWRANILSLKERLKPAVLRQLGRFAPGLKTLKLCSFCITKSMLNAIGGFRALEEVVIDLTEASLVIREVRILQ
jgi:hypothetical protein